MYLNLVGVEPDLVSDLEFSWWFAISGHFLLASSKRCFGIGASFFELIKAFVDCRNVAAASGRDGEVGLIAIYDFKWRVLQSRLNAAIDCEFPYWEKCGPVVLPLPGKESKVLFDLFVHPFSLPIRVRVVCGHELSIDTELLV